MATCWVMVEPPWTTRPAGQVDPRGARQPDRIDAGMVPEAPVLHRDRRCRQVGWHVAQPQRLADDIAEGGEHLAGAILQRQARPPRGSQRGLRPRQVAREPQQHDGNRQRAPDGGDDGVANAAESAGDVGADTAASQRRARPHRRPAFVGSKARGARHWCATDTGSAACRESLSLRGAGRRSNLHPVARTVGGCDEGPVSRCRGRSGGRVPPRGAAGRPAGHGERTARGAARDSARPARRLRLRVRRPQPAADGSRCGAAPA